ncbi:phage tail protein [Dickeya undicola]|uniref:Phage tail protein n=1 Tax=Dickeya undicola TaxID=1577887 RepID=A0A3N0FQK0_9GAMM|nr:phage tail protein [Dickeya undicola]RNM02352.1 phage tail protein [Dickeya undicola]
MSTKYIALLTEVGAARLANAIALGKQLEITQMGVGDGGGTLPTPDATQTKLINEKRRASLNSLNIDPANPNQIIAEQVIPENEGGFWLREIGLYDGDGNLVAVANCPETYKPQMQEGSGRVQTVRMILAVSNSNAVTLKIDPAVVLATRKYVDDNAVEVKTYADTLMTSHIADTNPHKQYAPIASPVFTGNPAAPTAAAGTNTTQLATTAFVAGAIDLLSSKTDSSIKLKLDINDIVGIPLPWPQATAPAGWLKCNGQTFDKNLYPRLAQVYPSGVLPDLRGEFIRGWDDGRGVDNGRAIASKQSATGLRTGMMDYNGSDIGSASVYIGMAYADSDSSTSTISFSNQGYPDGTLMAGSAGKDNGVSGTASNTVFANGVNWITVRPRNVAFNYIVRAV